MSDTSSAASERPRGSWGESLGLVFAFAMLLSALYVVDVGRTYFVRHSFVAASRDVVWMAPLSALLFCTVGMAPFILAAPLWSRARAREIAIFGGAFIVVFAVLLPRTQIHRLAAALLAAGAATLAMRMLVYEQLIGIPLILRFDGRIPSGRRTPDVVSLRDLAATIIEVAGVTPRTPMPGRSLAAFWSADSTTPREHSAAISELVQLDFVRTNDELMRAQMMSLIERDRHFIRRNKRGVEELYDIRNDRHETRNLLKSGEEKAVADTLRERLRALIAADRPAFQR